MRPLFQRNAKFMIAYPIYAAIGGGFGYWLDGVDKRQMQILEETKRALIEKRRRVAERLGTVGGVAEEGSAVAAPAKDE